MAVTPEAPLLWLETLLRSLGGAESSLLVLDLKRGPGRSLFTHTDPSGLTASPPRPTAGMQQNQVPCQCQQGQREPSRQAVDWTSAPPWGRGRERPGAWKGAWGPRLLSKAEGESFPFSQHSQLGPQHWANRTSSHLEFPHAACVTVDPGLSGWKQPLQR